MKKFLFIPLALRCANSSSSQSMKGYIPFLSILFLAASCGVEKSPDTGGAGSPGGAFDYAPEASPDYYTINEDAGTILLGVLANDSDQNGNALTLKSIDDFITDGTASIVGDDVSFTADADFNGVITFSYVVEDSTGMQDIGVVTVDVLSINDAPRSAGLAADIDEDAGPTTFDVMEDPIFALDVEGDSFFLDSVTDPDNGGVVIILNNTQFTYQPASDFWGEETFTFRLNDGLDVSDHTVTITVTDIDDVLVVNDGADDTDEDMSVEIDLAQYAVHIDDQTLELVLGSLGMVVGEGDVDPVGGTVVSYKHPVEHFNNDENPVNPVFAFTLSDGITAVTATVTMTVNPVNDAPTSGPVHGDAVEDMAYFIEVLDAASDIDVDDVDNLTVSLLSGETTEETLYGGTVEVFENKLVYTSALNSNNFITAGADDVITYVLTDPSGGTVVLQATVTVTPVNDPITVLSGSRVTPEDSALWIDFSTLVINADLDVLNVVVWDFIGSEGGQILHVPSAGPLMFEYRPAADFTGVETFSCTVNDGVDNGAGDPVTEGSGTVTVTVEAVNDGPTGDLTVEMTADENDPVVVDLAALANIVDVDGDVLVYTFPALSQNGGTIGSNSSSTFQYTSLEHYNSDLNGDDSFVVTVDDQSLLPHGVIEITVNVVVTPVDDTLGTQNILVSTHLEDTTDEYDVLALAVTDNFDEDEVTLDSHADFSIAGGIVTQSSPGVLRYTPPADWNSVDNGPDSVSFILNDGTQDYFLEIEFDVLDVNDSPVASNGSETAIEDLPIDWPIVTSYVTDVDPASTTTFTLESAIAASGATVTIDPTGQFVTYQAPLNYNLDLDGVDIVTYTVLDSSGELNNFASGEIVVAVTPVNDVPTVRAGFTLEGLYIEDTAYVGIADILGAEDLATPIDIFALSFVEDVDDPNNDHSSLTISVESLGDGAALISALGPQGDGTISYQSSADGPVDDFTGKPVGDGKETITLRISDDGFDANGDPNSLFVLVDMSVWHIAVNDPPRLGDFSTSVDEDNILNIDLLLAGAFDIEDDIMTLLTFEDTSAAGWPISSLGSGVVEYAPGQDYEEVDTFRYRLTDSQPMNSDSVAFTATVTVNPVNDAPTATDGTATTNEDTSVSTDVVALGSDVDLNETLTLDSVTQGTNGSVSISGDDAVYMPNPDFPGPSDSYTFTIRDTGGLTVTETITVTILPVNDPPRGGNFASVVDEDQPLTLDLVIDSGAFDIEGDLISLSGLPTSLEGGVIVLDGANVVTYTPPADFEGIDSITFTLTDSQLENPTGTFTLTVTVNPVPDAPVANDDSWDDPIEALKFWRHSGPIDITFDVLANDTDADAGDVLVVDAIDVGLTTGIVDLTANVLTYQPAEGPPAGIDTFDYEVSDSDIATLNDTATVTVDVADNNSVKYTLEGGGVQPAGWPSMADDFGYALVLDGPGGPGDNASVMRISDAISSDLGDIVWQVSMVTPGAVTLPGDFVVASNESNEAIVAAVYSSFPDTVFVTSINFDGSLAIALSLGSSVLGDIAVEGLALDELGGCVIGLRLGDDTLRIVHVEGGGVLAAQKVVDPLFGTINNISKIGDAYYCAMSTGIMKLDADLLGVYYFGDIISPININSVRTHTPLAGVGNIVVAGSNGYLALIDDITVPTDPTGVWARDVSSATLETVEFYDIVSRADGNVYAVGETSDGQATFYSVASDTGFENFGMTSYPSLGDSSALNTLRQSGSATEQSVVGGMVSAADFNFFRLEVLNTSGEPIISCSDYDFSDSGFTAVESLAVMSVEVITDEDATDISGGASPVSIGTPTSVFLRRANL